MKSNLKDFNMKTALESQEKVKALTPVANDFIEGSVKAATRSCLFRGLLADIHFFLNSIFRQFEKGEGSRFITLIGAEGSGKTIFVADVIAPFFKGLGIIESTKIVKLSASRLYRSWEEEAKNQIRKKLNEARGGILILDDFHIKTPGADFLSSFLFWEASEMKFQNTVFVLQGKYNMVKDLLLTYDLGETFNQTLRFQLPDLSNEQLAELFEVGCISRGVSVKPDARPAATLFFHKLRNLKFRKKQLHFSKKKSYRYQERSFAGGSEVRFFLQSVFEAVKSNNTISHINAEVIFSSMVYQDVDKELSELSLEYGTN